MENTACCEDNTVCSKSIAFKANIFQEHPPELGTLHHGSTSSIGGRALKRADSAICRGILLRESSVLDALNHCTTIAVDKTGTLTTGTMSCIGMLDPMRPESHLDLSGQQLDIRPRAHANSFHARESRAFGFSKMHCQSGHFELSQ